MFNFQRYNLPGNGITCQMVKVWAPRRHHTWPQRPQLVSRLTVYPILNMSLYVNTCIYQNCLSSCHDTFDNFGREYEEVLPQLSQHEQFNWIEVPRLTQPRYRYWESCSPFCIGSVLPDFFLIVCWNPCLKHTSTSQLGTHLQPTQKSTYPWAYRMSDNR